MGTFLQAAVVAAIVSTPTLTRAYRLSFAF